jgi:hypothetical protein
MSTIGDVTKAPTDRTVPRTGPTIENMSVVNTYHKYMGGVNSFEAILKKLYVCCNVTHIFYCG